MIQLQRNNAFLVNKMSFNALGFAMPGNLVLVIYDRLIIDEQLMKTAML